jgi:hypothetical protein
MVVESFLKGNSSRNCKHKLIRKMASSFLEICRDKYGFHAAFTALNVCSTDGHVDTHAQLSRQIKQNREFVARSEWGQKLLKKLAQQRAKEEDDAAEANRVPLTVESLLEPEKSSKKSKKKAKKRNKKREREEEEQK